MEIRSRELWNYYYDLLSQLAAQIKKHTYIKEQREMNTKKQILTYTCSDTKL